MAYSKQFLPYPVLIVVAIVLSCLGWHVVPLVFLVGYWLIGIPFLSYLHDKSDDLLHPAGPLIVLVFLYSIASILYYYGGSGMTWYGDAISKNSLVLFCVACILGELGIIIGASIALQRKTNAGKRFNSDRMMWRRAIPSMIVLAIGLGWIFFDDVVVLFDFINPKAYSETALSSRVAMMEVGASAPITQVITQLLPSLLLIASGIFLTFKSNVFLRPVGLGILVSNILALALSGSKGGMFSTLSAIVIFVHYRVKRLRLPILVLGILVSIMLLNGISLARSTAKFGEMLDILAFETRENDVNLLDVSRSGELTVGLNLMKLIEAISSGESQFNYGKGFVDDILCYVPRVIYPNRPLPLSERFVEEFYPGVRDAGGGYGLFFLQDGYWAFGLIGVFISLTAYSWALSRIYIHIENYFDSDFIVLIYASVYFHLVIASPRSGLLLSFKLAAMDALPFVLVLAFSSVVLALGVAPRVFLDAEKEKVR